jgi:putative DNA methylase
MYEELARGFGVAEVRSLLESDKANGTRLSTPTGLAAAMLGTLEGAGIVDPEVRSVRGRLPSSRQHPFAITPLRHLMFAVRETAAAGNSPEQGRQYLRDTFGQRYWTMRERFVGLLEWLAQLANAAGMDEWRVDSEAARILAGRLRNDHA